MRSRWSEPDAAAPIDLRLALPALAVWAGCLTGLWASGWWSLAAVGTASAACLLTAAIRPAHRGIMPLVTLTICFAGAVGISTLQVVRAEADPLVAAAGSWVTVEAVIAADPIPMRDRFAAVRPDPGCAAAGNDDGSACAGRWRVSARARAVERDGSAAESRVTVTMIGSGPTWAQLIPGQVVSVRGSTGPDPFATLPGATMRVRGDVLPIADPPFWQRGAWLARYALAEAASTLGEERGGLLRGLVVGDTRGIPQDLTADAKTAGLTHLVAVSGTHMAIVGGAVLLLLRRFGPRAAAAGSSAAVIGMVVLVGPAPSVLRSAVMGFIGVAAVVTGRSRQALPALAAAVFLLLLIDPTLAVSAGFALSVQATGALILLAPAWERALRRRGIPRGWAAALAIPVAAHIATMPVIAGISGKVSLVAVAANIAVAPIVAPALLTGVACLVTAPWWPRGAEYLARIDSPLLGWISGTAHRLAAWPSATVPWPASPAGVLILAAALVALLLLLRHRPLRAAVLAATVGAGLVLLPAGMVSPGWPADGWLITACDVGQGDGIVLATGSPGLAVVVDTGPEPNAIDSCLTDLGITALGLLVITHLHADHVAGLDGVLKGRRVDAIGVGPDDSSPAALAALRAVADRRNIPVLTLALGSAWQIGDLDMTVIGPARTFHGTESDPNNDSLVMMAERAGVRMLLTGDIERPAQSALLRSGVDLRAEVLKQPHHGSSKLLPELLDAVGARVAVIGVGADNGYGHPAASALAADRSAGITTVLRTDTDGDVQVLLTPAGLATVARGSAAQQRPSSAQASEPTPDRAPDPGDVR